MDLDTLVNQSAVDYLFQIFALATALIFFWFLEGVYQHDKRWLIPIIIFPCSLFLFIIVYWEHNRGKCFFAALLLAIMLLVGGLVGQSFVAKIFALFRLVAFWPYYTVYFLFPDLSF